jgi:hypothetical protein
MRPLLSARSARRSTRHAPGSRRVHPLRLSTGTLAPRDFPLNLNVAAYRTQTVTPLCVDWSRTLCDRLRRLEGRAPDPGVILAYAGSSLAFWVPNASPFRGDSLGNLRVPAFGARTIVRY